MRVRQRHAMIRGVRSVLAVVASSLAAAALAGGSGRGQAAGAAEPAGRLVACDGQRRRPARPAHVHLRPRPGDRREPQLAHPAGARRQRRDDRDRREHARGIDGRPASIDQVRRLEIGDDGDRGRRAGGARQGQDPAGGCALRSPVAGGEPGLDSGDMSGHVLLIEDEPSVGELVRAYLDRDG